MCIGSLFQILGPQIEKALSPVLIQLLGTYSTPRSFDRSDFLWLTKFIWSVIVVQNSLESIICGL